MHPDTIQGKNPSLHQSSRQPTHGQELVDGVSGTKKVVPLDLPRWKFNAMVTVSGENAPPVQPEGIGRTEVVPVSNFAEDVQVGRTGEGEAWCQWW